MDCDEYESLPTHNVATHMMAGALAGVMEHCVMYPLDSVKTRMQSLHPSPKADYKTVGEALYKMVRYEGLLRPVRGINAVVVGAGPAHALYFSCYEKMKRVFSRPHNGSGGPLAQGAAGCLATLLHDAIMNPAEVVKQRMQMYSSPYRSCLDCFLSVWKLEGARAFYRSYITQLTMNLPFQCTHFIMYEFMQDLTNGERTYNPGAHMVSGAIAGGVASAVTTPLDVCKTLLNTQEQGMLTVAKQTQINGMFSAAAAVYKFRGLGGYFQGLQARVLYQMPSTAIAWSVYEFFKFWINQRKGHGSGSGSSASLFAALPTSEVVGSATQAPSIRCDDLMSTSTPVTTVCSSPL